MTYDEFSEQFKEQIDYETEYYVWDSRVLYQQKRR